MATFALICVYGAVMCGHLQSIDGLLVWRQGAALAYSHSLHFNPPIWWGSYGDTSPYGIGLSLLYLPGLLIGKLLQIPLPIQHGPTYDFSLLYDDRLYTIAGATLEIAIVALSAYLVARVIIQLGLGQSAALWGLALYGLGSPAIVYARGDWAQPLTGLCWIAALYAALRFRQGALYRWLWLCALAQGYALLTRPVEGALLYVAVIALMLTGPHPTLSQRGREQRWGREQWLAIGAVTGAALAAGALTLLVNWGRYGSPFTTGYGTASWTTPLPVGLAGALLSPGRGLIWEFPAVLLVPFGVRQLLDRNQRPIAVVFGGLCLLQLLNVAAWRDWYGGWNWGLRLFVPALPVLAVVAAAGIMALPIGLRAWIPALLLTGGLFWAAPAIVTDLLGGYGATYASTHASFSPKAYPPIGAWAFFHHWRATGSLDMSAADILWFRLARSTSNLSLIVPVVLGIGAAVLGSRALRGEPRLEARLAEG